ncbi:MAG: anti-sigma factor antagonist [Bacteroidales bacterium]|nr:anti-sigma factor antagonist [Bacteroidales bacterium]
MIKKVIGENAYFSFVKENRIDVTNVNLFKIKVLRSCVNPKVKNIIIDLKNLKFIDSYGANVLVILRKFASRKKTKFYLKNVTDDFREIIRLINIEKDFEELQNDY